MFPIAPGTMVPARGTNPAPARYVSMTEPFEISTNPPPALEAATLFWLAGNHDVADRERIAVLMRHAPELLAELKRAAALLVAICDHHRQGAPLPSPTDCRHAALDAWNAVALAEGRMTVGNRHYRG